MLIVQKNEIIEYYIYEKLAKSENDPHNKEILQTLAAQELKHYNLWKDITGEDVKPRKWKVRKYYFCSKLFGITFVIKLMEKGEKSAQDVYNKIVESPDATDIVKEYCHDIIKDEGEHEDALIELLDEERLHYVGSMVLGLNDALVELTGALAGLTFALQDTNLISLTELITGIAAALSMGASEYLSTKSEGGTKKPGKAALYTGGAYISTVFLLILPYILFSNYFLCLTLTLISAIFVILIFNYYICVAKGLPFKKRFLEMVSISLGIATISFGIGVLLRIFFKV
ncbi:MAG: VIT1/CCC1 transporter family protein [Promethearchaeota archaeon]